MSSLGPWSHRLNEIWVSQIDTQISKNISKRNQSWRYNPNTPTHPLTLLIYWIFVNLDQLKSVQTLKSVKIFQSDKKLQTVQTLWSVQLPTLWSIKRLWFVKTFQSLKTQVKTVICQDTDLSRYSNLSRNSKLYRHFGLACPSINLLFNIAFFQFPAANCQFLNANANCQ